MLGNTLDGDRGRIPLRFRVPDELREIALEETPEERARTTFERFRGKLRITERQAFHLAISQEHMVARLREEGAVYVGQCVARSEVDPTSLTSAQYTILVTKAELDAENPLDAVAVVCVGPVSPVRFCSPSFRRARRSWWARSWL